MKLKLITSLLAVACATSLPAAITITVNMVVPNGSASGGSGNGGGSVLTTTLGTIGAAVALPDTVYTVSGIDLTQLGGTATESFIFTLTYAGTTDGNTPADPAFTAFGNVGTGGDGQVSGTETLTATIALTSTSFVGLSLNGFTLARAGGVGTGETGTFTWANGGSYNLSNGNTITNSVSGNYFTLALSRELRAYLTE
jgi:hypothetical protein